MDATSPLAEPERTPVSHLRTALLRTVVALLARATRTLAPLDELLARHPELVPHLDLAAACGFDGCTLEAAVERLDAELWIPEAADWPLSRLRRALDLQPEGIDLFLLCALTEDDASLSGLVDELRGYAGRPTRAFAAGSDAMAAALPALLAGGFLSEQDAGRWRGFTMPRAVWDAVQGQCAGFVPRERLPEWDRLILPDAIRCAVDDAQASRTGPSCCWALRGRPGSGRRALAGAIARSAGLGLLVGGQQQAEPSQLAACATLLGAMPLLELAPAPGEQALLPALPGFEGPVAVRLPPQGGVASEDRPLRWVEVDMPGPAERARHWEAALGHPATDLALLDLRLPRGQIHWLAREVGDNAKAVALEVDLRGRYLLEGLAQRVSPPGAPEQLVLGEGQQQEFELLLARCRHREALPAVLPAAFGLANATGVRAMFKGPSGTGKTLAARHLAAALGRPLYRVDLAAIVSKYIGETERNLERVFGAAEALDIVLLLDEGDALMAGRTGVANANDRYANLETNFLLQRLESYDGILVVTTNAAERIDAAFARRMDATLEFTAPDAQTRHALWLAHLPADHALAAEVLEELALRCALTGAQVRNAALHATLLGLEQGAGVGTPELATALRREYRRAGQACPSLDFARTS